MINMRIINALIIVDIGIVIFCMLVGERSVLISSQVGYVSSLLVVLASMLSYKNMVAHSVENGLITSDNDKVLEEIEDPHGLYDDTSHSEFISESKSGDEILKQVGHDNDVQDDKQSQELEDEPKRTTTESLKHSRASLSIYRLIAYGVLIAGFMLLSSEHVLHLPSYLFGIFIAPVITVGMIFFESKR